MAQRNMSLFAIFGALVALPWIFSVFLGGRSSSPDGVAARLGVEERSVDGRDLTVLAARTNSAREEFIDGARAQFPSETVPTAVDELLLLVAFGWSIEEVQARFAAGNSLARAEILAGLLEIEPDDEATKGAEIALASLEGVGIGDEESAIRLSRWADRDSARQLFRPIGRVLIGQGKRGEELAAELAKNQWERAFENSSDKVSFLCASYIVHELKDARAVGAVPTLQLMADRAITRASDLAAAVEERAGKRLAELAAEGGRAQAPAKWGEDVIKVEVDEMTGWRNRGTEAMEALVAIGSSEVAEWVEANLLKQTSDQINWTGAALIAALYTVLPENPDGELAKRLKPWVMDCLGSNLPETAWEKSVVYRIAGIYGEQAIPALVEALSSPARHGSVTVESAASLAQAVLTSDSGAGVAMLRKFMRGERSLAGSGEISVVAHNLVMQAMSKRGTEEDRHWIRNRIAGSTPEDVALMLELLPDSMWEERPEDLVTVLERMEAFLKADSWASLSVDLALDRLLRTSDDLQSLIAHLAGSPSPRLAQKCSVAMWRWRMEHEESPSGKLALLRQRFYESKNPFRRVLGGASLWNIALTVARDPGVPVESIATELDRGDCPLGMRVVLCRALALRGTDEDLTALEGIVPDLVDACRGSVAGVASWARQFELGLWKSIAWLAVSGLRGRGVARTALDRLLPDGRAVPSTLDDRMPLLIAYLEAMAHSGLEAYAKRLEEFVELWNQGEDRLEVLESVQAFCSEAPGDYLASLMIRKEIPFALRSEALLSLFRSLERPRESVRVLASNLYASAWHGAEENAVEASFTRLIDRAPEGKEILIGVLEDLVNEGDPANEVALTILARTLGVGELIGEPAAADH